MFWGGHPGQRSRNLELYQQGHCAPKIGHLVIENALLGLVVSDQIVANEERHIFAALLWRPYCQLDPEEQIGRGQIAAGRDVVVYRGAARGALRIR